MSPEDFSFVADFLKKKSGISLTDDKTYLVESRLLPLARQHDLDDITGLVAAMKGGRGSLGDHESLMDDVLDAMTTNETFFFRDNKPFDAIRKDILPQLIERRKSAKSLRIWCAAASTGQEPYSIAMLLKEYGAQLNDWRLSILGTDVSGEALKRAEAGNYSQFEVQRGLPAQLLIKYLHKEEKYWMINSELKSMIRYKKLNLLSSFESLGKFDIVFCRNVLIYFEVETKRQILERISRQMPPDGILVLGSAETVLNVSDHFQLIPGLSGFYKINPAMS
ncbi:MAG: protein-glutamate O-methyltransferase CheR [Rhodospirillaceae bacterium]|nr:protein-glutamate O-methyltransferase CheR [Rhodospirillaceae bacterium]MBT5307722.1 protein-glutamate O-methyltransferase CheR [Rhodospirillaceae bacterium]MBT7355247.1 protein-glutamate O-methyltransferase CheR [Rhodospirillaceae bacterium]